MAHPSTDPARAAAAAMADDAAGSKEEQAWRAQALAEKCFLAGNVHGARQWMQSAARLAPGLPGTARVAAAYDVHAAAAAARGGPDCWYAVLGLRPPGGGGPRVTRDDVKRQHRRLCLLVHPDKNPCAAADGAFKLVQAAWQELSARHPPTNPHLRGHRSSASRPHRRGRRSRSRGRGLRSCRCRGGLRLRRHRGLGRRRRRAPRTRRRGRSPRRKSGGARRCLRRAGGPLRRPGTSARLRRVHHQRGEELPVRELPLEPHGRSAAGRRRRLLRGRLLLGVAALKILLDGSNKNRFQFGVVRRVVRVYLCAGGLWNSSSLSWVRFVTWETLQAAVQAWNPPKSQDIKRCVVLHQVSEAK
ncbi:hypothetical protein PAHAL_9G184000 [Panicum hallii]|jgi:curved DNA-binding protein CbpA|uniref:J domain-containing protein n=1 Tax=Panicum hallii TaxID=206008 RepID=A0A2T8I1Q6_9POAL|nr:uncharacterized protein LOC112872783 [Panicum hallii]PVH31591.1 hypothetical protein PAHAL_9G184000 [Panicum hallii]